MEIIFGVLEALHTKLQSVSAAHADGTSLMKTETWVKIILVELKEKSPQCITKEMSQIRITSKNHNKALPKNATSTNHIQTLQMKCHI